jgi:hypothetical protein
MICGGNALWRLLLRLQSKLKQKFNRNVLYNKQSPSSLNHLRTVCAHILCPVKQKIFKNTSLSANTVVENVDDLTGDIEC